MIVRIVPDRPSRFQKFRDDWDDWDDCWFPYDRLYRFKYWRPTVVSDVPGSDNRVLARYSETKWRISIEERVFWLVIFLFFRFCAVEELEESHEITGFGFDNQAKLLNSDGEGTASRPQPDGTYFFFLKYRPYAVRTFLYFFSASAASNPNFSPIAFQIFILINLFL